MLARACAALGRFCDLRRTKVVAAPMLSSARTRRGLLRSASSFTGVPDNQYPRSEGCSTSNDFPLTEEEAISYVKETLGMPDYLEQIRRDAGSFLDSLLCNYKLKTPSTNITMSPFFSKTLEVDERHLLEIHRDDVLSCRGGQCTWSNSFLLALLRCLGFEAGLVGTGDLLYCGMYDLHSAVIVYNASYQGSRHFLEGSNTLRLYRAVPLDFEDESTLYCFGERTWKFFRNDSDIFKLCQSLEAGENPPFQMSEVIEREGERWHVVLEYRTKFTKSLSHFFDVVTLLTRAPHVFRLLSESLLLNGFNGHKWVLVKNQNVILRDSAGSSLDKFELAIPQDLIDFVTENFDQYSKKEIEECLIHADYWRRDG